MFPSAPDLKTYWRNILAGVNAVGKPPVEWEADRYLSSGRIQTPYGGFLGDLYRFDPKEFGIMPNSVDGGEPDQFLALKSARDALDDAGYLNAEYDHEDSGIILGHSTYLHRGQGNLIQHNIVIDQTIEILRGMIPSLAEDKLSRIRGLLESKLPQFNADIAASLVPNAMTGRIANRLNFKGPNYIVDAACSSSLIAVSAAMDELRNRRCRLMLAGGVNASIPAEVSVIFTLLGALSERGEVLPFDEKSDGTLLGEGLGVVVLKRLHDAITDRDRVYAVIRGVGLSSDGRGHGVLAPSLEGESLAISRAYDESGVDPASVELIEAHGTGIPLGDRTEISALKRVFGERKGLQGSVALGSVKSMISHCIPAAGIAGLIKSALALHHKVLPPTRCERVSGKLGMESTPFYVNTEPKPWISVPGIQRMAGVDSFGFGGINSHAILEEAPEGARRPRDCSGWPFELCVFSAPDRMGLMNILEHTAGWIAGNPDLALCDVAATLASTSVAAPDRLALVAKSRDDCLKKIEHALKRLRKDTVRDRWSTRSGIVYSCRPLDGKLAFLFPGEGSQYLGMFSELMICFDEVREWFDFWKGLYNETQGETRTDILLPPASELTEERRAKLEELLYTMDIGSESVFVAGQAMYAILDRFGVVPDVMVGHSTGESSALVASGAIRYDDRSQLADFVRELNQVYLRVLEEGSIAKGALMTVGALERSEIEKEMVPFGEEVVVAMENCRNQLVLFGPPESIERLRKGLTAKGGLCALLPFDRGYHTPQFAAVSRAFLAYYEKIGLGAPRTPLYSCVSVDCFPDDPEGVRSLAAGQWASKVRFRETVLKMYEEGVRYFLEVGPSGNLASFVKDILAGREYMALATNLKRKNCLEQFLVSLGTLYVNDMGVKLERMFVSRDVRIAEIGGAAAVCRPTMRLDNTMPVIHLDKDDKDELESIVESGAESRLPGTVCAVPRASSSERYHMLPGDEADDLDGVMKRHFDLMSDFLDQQQRIVERYAFPDDAGRHAPSAEDLYTPFIDSIVECDDEHLVAECALSVAENNFLRDHVLSGPVSDFDPCLTGLACVPLMVTLEILAEAAVLFRGDRAVSAIENVRAFDWIALDEGKAVLTIQVESSPGDPDRCHAVALIEGKKAVSADFLWGDVEISGMLAELESVHPPRWDGRDLYRVGMFHGPVFRSIQEIEGWNEEGMDAFLSPVSLRGFFRDDETAEMVLNPVLLDAVGQLSAYWIAHKIGTSFNCFPATIGRIEIRQPHPKDQSGLKMKGRHKPLGLLPGDVDAPKRWDFECVDSVGRTILKVENLINVFYPVPERFFNVRMNPHKGCLGSVKEMLGAPGVLVWILPHLAEDFCRQSSGIFLRILACAVLGEEERREWRLLEGGLSYRIQWLLGRACIKEAVRHWVYEKSGKLLFPADIRVRHEDAGAPFVDGIWRDVVSPAPPVSLSHDHGLCVAAVAEPGLGVGVDVESLERAVRTDLLESAMTPQERESLGHSSKEMREKVIRIWCAKEAAAKYLGSGLQGRPEDFEVSFTDNGWGLALVARNGTVVGVRLEEVDRSIIAIAADHQN
ncbi:MAG: acyltransferase domain-containing protein [Deltaproteobacteria bacterium]|nr:acyltransferase domain-containing protein [Deltaproteobacteria bacterium]